MKNRIAVFFTIDKMFLVRIVFIITVAVMLAAIIFGLLMFWNQPPHATSITSFELKG